MRHPPALGDRHVTKTVYCLLVLISLTPVWRYRYIPTQDGPSHLYNAIVLQHLLYNDHYYTSSYALRTSAIPNMSAHLLLAIIMTCLPPLYAEKLLLTTYICGTSLASWYLSNAVSRARPCWAFLTPLCVYSFHFFMGFYGYMLSIPLFLFTTGFAWRHRDSLTRRRGITLAVLLTGIYFTHLASFLLSALSLTIILLFSARGPFHGALTLAGVLICPFLLLSTYTIQTGAQRVAEPLQSLLRTDVPPRQAQPLTQTLFPIGSSATHWMVYAICGTISATVFVAAMRRILHHSFADTSVHKGPLLLFGAILVGAHAIIPQCATDNGGFVPERIGGVLPFLLAGMLPAPSRPWTHRGVVIMICIATTAQVAAVSRHFSEWNRQLQPFLVGTRLITPGDRILPFVKAQNKPFNSWAFADNYYCFTPGVINLHNYEADREHFVVRFVPDEQRPTRAQIEQETALSLPVFLPVADVVLVWNGTDQLLDYLDARATERLVRGALGVYRMASGSLHRSCRTRDNR